MSNQTVNRTRRHLLKGAAYTSLLTIVGASSTAFAKMLSGSQCVASSEHMSCGLRIKQQTLKGRESVTVTNDSGKLVMMNALQPITLEQKKGVLKVTINQNEADAINGKIIISDGERITFDIKAIETDLSTIDEASLLSNMSQNTFKMVSENTSFNRIVAVQLA